MSSLSQEIPSSAMRSETQTRLGEEGVLVNRGAGLGIEELDSANLACRLVHFFLGWWVTGLGREVIASGGVESEKSMGCSLETVFGFWKSRIIDLLEALVLSGWVLTMICCGWVVFSLLRTQLWAWGCSRRAVGLRYADVKTCEKEAERLRGFLICSAIEVFQI
ncbi:NAD(P)-binding Rossmann-fold superfamily protein [Striga asiatica]|uniref:NAD(P)-binding Rossmann-fold superfamily protein n=1 Tax=Striga asiatica TaxID=4170 RepID=A0A5A7PMT8_STRAF|nr:NAD(P)-binding Rossmann-fold superfamily protein [Striga asiatica]